MITNSDTYGTAVDESFAEQCRRLLERDLLTAAVRHSADRPEKQVVLEPDLLRFAVVLDVHVNWHREAAIAGLCHLIRRLLDHCNRRRNSKLLTQIK